MQWSDDTSDERLDLTTNKDARTRKRSGIVNFTSPQRLDRRPEGKRRVVNTSNQSGGEGCAADHRLQCISLRPGAEENDVLRFGRDTIHLCYKVPGEPVDFDRVPTGTFTFTGQNREFDLLFSGKKVHSYEIHSQALS